MKTANENRTHIYRIRRKADGLFLVWMGRTTAGGHSQKGIWEPTGAFWRKPETIRKHLLELITYRVYEADHPMNAWPRSGKREKHGGKDLPPQFTVFPCGTKLKGGTVHYQWLELYEVVATEITVHGEQVMEAKDFACFNPVDMVKSDYGT